MVITLSTPIPPLLTLLNYICTVIIFLYFIKYSAHNRDIFFWRPGYIFRISIYCVFTEYSGNNHILRKRRKIFRKSKWIIISKCFFKNYFAQLWNFLLKLSCSNFLCVSKVWKMIQWFNISSQSNINNEMFSHTAWYNIFRTPVRQSKILPEMCSDYQITDLHYLIQTRNNLHSSCEPLQL